MDDRDAAPSRPSAIEGADDAALGIAAPPASAPPGARVDSSEHLVPGPMHDGPGHAAKPWATSLAAESDQAGVANDSADAQEPQYPTGDDEAV